MRIYIVEYDNGFDYSDQENYIVGVFHTFKKAEDYCLTKGYNKTDVEGYYEKDFNWGNYKRSLSINMTYINEVINEAE